MQAQAVLLNSAGLRFKPCWALAERVLEAGLSRLSFRAALPGWVERPSENLWKISESRLPHHLGQVGAGSRSSLRGREIVET